MLLVFRSVSCWLVCFRVDSLDCCHPCGMRKMVLQPHFLLFEAVCSGKWLLNSNSCTKSCLHCPCSRHLIWNFKTTGIWPKLACCVKKSLIHFIKYLPKKFTFMSSDILRRGSRHLFAAVYSIDLLVSQTISRHLFATLLVSWAVHRLRTQTMHCMQKAHLSAFLIYVIWLVYSLRQIHNMLGN